MTDKKFNGVLFFIIFLRVMGTASFFAILFIYVPHSWMDSVHKYLGMGPLPTGPIVGYLARSTSAFYTFLGGLLWVCSFDLERFLPILKFLGYAFCLFGLSIFVIDWIEGMPLFWKVAEGPIDTLFGIVVLYFAKHISPPSR